jgi:hypothetical protein
MAKRARLLKNKFFSRVVNGLRTFIISLGIRSVATATSRGNTVSCPKTEWRERHGKAAAHGEIPGLHRADNSIPG